MYLLRAVGKVCYSRSSFRKKSSRREDGPKVMLKEIKMSYQRLFTLFVIAALTVVVVFIAQAAAPTTAIVSSGQAALALHEQR